MTGTSAEDYRKVRLYRPPYWCETCDVGQSIPNCWLCGQPCQKTRPVNVIDRTYLHPPGSLGARSMPSAGNARHDDDQQ